MRKTIDLEEARKVLWLKHDREGQRATCPCIWAVTVRYGGGIGHIDAVIMPNYFHGIVIINENSVGAIDTLTGTRESPLRSRLFQNERRQIDQQNPWFRRHSRLATKLLRTHYSK